MEVLDLLLTFQFNSRLESFIAKFKTADLSSTGHQRGVRSLLCPLLVETFDPFDQSKYATTRFVHCKKYPYIHGYFAASFSYFNGTGSVYVRIRKSTE